MEFTHDMCTFVKQKTPFSPGKNTSMQKTGLLCCFSERTLHIHTQRTAVDVITILTHFF